MSDTGLMPPSPETALPDPTDADNVVYDPSLEQLREFSRELETTTEFGSPAYVSEQRSRCADRTKNAVDDEFDAADHAHIETALVSTAGSDAIPTTPTSAGTTSRNGTPASR